jgi:hypothetical protein
MLKPNQKITCPFCFETFETPKVEYRCVNPRCPKREEDTLYANARGIRPMAMGHVFNRPARSWIEKLFRPGLAARCQACAKETSKRLCPHCHFELSHDAGLIEDHIIAIIGGPNTGKGHYIATLIHRLENEVGAQFNFSLRMLGDETRDRFERDYRSPLFRRKIVIEPTQSATINSGVKLPMVFRLTIQNGKKLRAVNMSFFDSAGEDMKSLDIMSAEARYICYASGIVFLLDPLQIDAVRQIVPDQNLPVRDPMSEPPYIVERLRELFERQFNLSPTKRIEIPVAFVLSKVDTLFPIIDPGSGLKLTGEHFGYFNTADAQSIHTEIWNYLQSWMGGGFSDRVKTNFSIFNYFGVSSLGSAPSKEGKVESISSLRIEDPFLWILYELGLIKAQKGK